MTSDEILLEEYDGIHDMVDQARSAAEDAAFNALPADVQLQIQDRIDENNRRKLDSQTGNILVPTR